jgi:hypothetical protein
MVIIFIVNILFLTATIPILLLRDAVPKAFYSIDFNKYESNFLNDPTAVMVAELCMNQTTNVSQVRCVVDFYYDKYNFTPHNDTIRSPTDFIEKGGVCRDFAVSICTSLELLKHDCDYIFPPSGNHVFPIFTVDNGEYCTYDGHWSCG